jgi:hypothetical protein
MQPPAERQPRHHTHAAADTPYLRTACFLLLLLLPLLLLQDQAPMH